MGSTRPRGFFDRLRARDERALAEVSSAHAQRLIQVIRGLGEKRTDLSVEELAQEAFVLAYQEANRFRGNTEEDISTWLDGLARRVARP
jgi:DNA-directed RNA polymerase specialized sigma24 family protein